MKNARVIRNNRSNTIVLRAAKWCQSFWCHFRGLQFVFHLPQDEGLLFVTPTDSIVNTSIHMLFMFMEIGVVWVDSSGRVVDKKLAKPWRLLYAPQQAARYYIEAHPSILERVEIGDVLSFHEEVS